MRFRPVVEETSAPNSATIVRTSRSRMRYWMKYGRAGSLCVRNFQLEARAGTVEFVLHGGERLVGIGRGSLLRLRKPRWPDARAGAALDGLAGISASAINATIENRKEKFGIKILR